VVCCYSVLFRSDSSTCKMSCRFKTERRVFISHVFSPLFAKRQTDLIYSLVELLKN